MSYPVFPTLPGLEFPVKRTPLAASLRQKAISGRETFQPKWTAPLYQYEVSFALLRAAPLFAEWQALAGFWNSVMFAPGGVFQFDDPNDDRVNAQPTGTGDGSTTSFQLVRSLGGFTEPVLCPTPQIALPSVLLDYGAAAPAPTVDLDYGNCTSGVGTLLDDGYCAALQVFAGGLLAPYVLQPGGVVAIVPAPAIGVPLTWTGCFAWLCRFDEDSLAFANFMHLFWELKTCRFTTVRL